MILALIALAMLGLMITLWRLNYRDLYDNLLLAWGVNSKFKSYVPFMDTHVVLAAIQCHRLGYDVFEQNPCDIMGRWHVYSPVWLLASPTELGTGDTPWVGICQAVAFILITCWIMEIVGTVEVLICGLALFSQATVMAVDRGNFDLSMYVLVCIGAVIILFKGINRYIGYAVIFVSALLKFYPIFALIAALRESIPRLVAIAAAAGSLWALFFIGAHDELAKLWPHIPRPQPFQDTFGGFNIFQDAEHLVIRRYPAFAKKTEAIGNFLYIASLISAVGLSLFLASNFKKRAYLQGANERTTNLFIVGATLGSFAFFFSQSPPYRAIWLLLALPYLIVERRQATPERRQFWNLLIAGQIALLWFEAFHMMIARVTQSEIAADIAVVMIREPLWWGFMVVLLGILWVRISDFPVVVGILKRAVHRPVRA